MFDAFRNLLRWVRRHRGQWKVCSVAEPPVTARRGGLYLVGEVNDPWAAVLMCPCGCDARTELLLCPGSETFWRVSGAATATSLTPSVWRTSGCRSHYFVRRSRIEWC